MLAGAGVVGAVVSCAFGGVGVSPSFFSASLFMSMGHLIGSLDRGQRNVVVLRMSSAEVLHPVDDRFHQEIDALRAGLVQHGLELLLAKFVAFFIERFVDSIGVNHHGIE